MKVIKKIAKAELSQFFYSPIAWLVLIVFTVQSGIVFVNNFQTELYDYESGSGVRALTETIFTNSYKGVLAQMRQYLYLYIPLLTMGLISKEKANGSIKLLFSSPISNTQIIMGKFISMMILGLILMSVICVYALFGYFIIEQFDTTYFLSALLGIYLLTCAYAAIGLFMSTLTSYQVVAVVSSLAVLTILNLIGGMWSDIPYLREIAYWLSLKGRTNEMMQGLISSVDFIYFLLIIGMFITLSICKLNNERKRLTRSMSFMRYAIIIAITFAIGQITTIPHLKFFYDGTCTKARTLTPSSQAIMKKMDGPLTITAYVNLLDEFYGRYMPKNQYYDKKNFEYFTRFKPEIKFKYVYYWDKARNPYLYAAHPGKTDQEIANTLIEKLELDPNLFKSVEEVEIPEQIKQEGNRFARMIERGDGQKTILRIFESSGFEPEENHIAAAMKRLVDGPCRMAFLTGHGEPSILRIGERGMSNFTITAFSKASLINNGFDVFEINLKEQHLDTTKVDLLVLTQNYEPYSDDEMKQLKAYLKKGGNMFIAGEPGCQSNMNPLLEDFGIQFIPGRIMQNHSIYASNLALSKPTKEMQKLAWEFRWMNKWNYKTPMPNAVGIDLTNAASKGVETKIIMETDSTGFWNELTNISYTETEAEFNPELGETETAFAMAVRANRTINGKEQRLFITGDTDWLTNGERSTKRSKLNANTGHLQDYLLEWLTYNNYPVKVKRPSSPDYIFHIKTDSLPAIKGIFWFGFPLLMIITCIAIQVKRKRK
ncbi:MAG: Gldg family protein [Paludibacteraceae bacterium]|nr:Gldg family protein [Paludibacteraceae bacterium]